MSDPARHDAPPVEPVAARTIATWPTGTFIENIAAFHGGFVVSIHNARELHRVALDGSHGVLATLPVSPAGIVASDDGLFVVGGEPGIGPHALYHIGSKGTVCERLVIPGTLFLNGFTPWHCARTLTVDSLVGALIEIDLAANTSRVILQHELLTKISDEPMLPGANGIKLGGDAIYITNTDRALVLRLTIGSDGIIGEPQILAADLRCDDLAIDTDGALYLSNHIHNTLTRLAPDGARIAIAGPEQGMAGSTACVFGTAIGDPTGLYVTTTGGVIMPFEGVSQEAKLVRLETGRSGVPLPLPTLLGVVR